MSKPYPLKPWIKVFCAIGVLVFLILASPSHSAVYKWKDEKGKTHFTDSLSKIPPQYRKKGKLKPMKGTPAEASKPVKLLYPKTNPNVYVVPVQAYGDGHFIVEALINGNITANLLVDTGATSVVLSEQLGERLRVNKKDFPITTSNTGGGKVESPLFILESLKVGNSELFLLEAKTNPHFNKRIDGVLGMNFLGEFKMEIDRKNSKMYLRPTVDYREMLWDGHNEAWWRSKFKSYVKKMRKYRHLINNYRMSAKDQYNYRKMISHYSKLHQALDKRADYANLPKEYRTYP